MFNLFKYEFRKTWFSKLIILILTALAECVFLVGFFRENDTNTSVGIILLVAVGLFGIIYIGIDSMLVLQRDLNTKQSYMLFMTPNNSFKILGSKVIENSISIILAAVFFAALAYVDIQMLFNKYGAQYNFLDLFKMFLAEAGISEDIFSVSLVLTFFASLVANWLATVVSAFLAIVLSATFLAGKKLSPLLSFALFIALNVLMSQIIQRITKAMALRNSMQISICLSLVIAVVWYFVTAWIMEKKLSV